MSASFDLIVIGGGSGGSALAQRAAAYGAKVALVERGPTRDADGIRTGGGPGGTCVNVGCVPKKLTLLAARQREQMESAKAWGFEEPTASAQAFDWKRFKVQRDAYLEKLRGNYKTKWAGVGIEEVVGVASFVDKNTVKVDLAGGGEKMLTAPKIAIAVGGTPTVPPIPGCELAITSDGFFDLETQPKKVAVLGAGYIAVEMAGILKALGAETHLYFRGKTVMRRGFDEFIVDALMKEMDAHGPTLHPNSTLDSFHKAEDGSLRVVTKDTGKPLQTQSDEGYDCILAAIGRRPVTNLLALEKAGVSVTEAGLIEVDQFENTNVDGIYALGDNTTTGFDLTPVAIAAGRRLADRLFGGEPKARIDYKTIATVVFSHPPIATIGLTEQQAKQEYGDANIQVKTSSFNSMDYAFHEESAKVKTGFKLILKMPEEKIVGMHLIGPHVDEMMQGFAVAVRMGATRRDFEATVAIHPTAAEELVTFANWGQTKKADGGLSPQLPPYLD